MKKTMTLVLAVMIIAGASALVKAQEESAPEPKGPMMMKDGKMGKDCMKCMMKKSMVSVGDGVVVMMGDKLLKYDADLNLVKEVPLPQDMMCAWPKGGMKGEGKGSMKGSGKME